MTSDPVDIAAALISNRQSFVLALVMGCAGRAEECVGDMTIFAANGIVLAGKACRLGSGAVLQRKVQECFASESRIVLDIDVTGRAVADGDARPGNSLKIYLEAVVPRTGDR
ncbi:hypothetical protein [Cupriavidus lacunae]|uniref:XdhC- CoxI domain-containing protein n=1 Tax=Cupriavidus lacunae TaxID=2666307 RepID=A0A370NSQ4_9BURK|nr:hypothetical protein [Cupriavidus lacunae]RDK08614.1 hypothetical protein DN412_19600 [Cupriavidus lacunae]